MPDIEAAELVDAAEDVGERGKNRTFNLLLNC